jgi:hypothetical protein
VAHYPFYLLLYRSTKERKETLAGALCNINRRGIPSPPSRS